MRNRRRKNRRVVTRQEFIDAWELAEEMGMPEGAAVYWAHEYCGLEYGEGFDLLAESPDASPEAQK